MDTQRRHDATEAELAKERVAGLGITGHRLSAAILRYERAASHWGEAHPKTLAALAELRQRCADLLLQREMSGLVERNFDWLFSAYRIPAAVENQLRRCGYGSPIVEGTLAATA